MERCTTEAAASWAKLPALPRMDIGTEQEPEFVDEKSLPRSQFVELESGVCSYRLFECQNESAANLLPLVLALHGLTSASFLFDPLASYLVSNNLASRVIVPDFYGRGLSPWPKDQIGSESFFAKQSKNVVEKIVGATIDEISVIVIGYSFGGLVSVSFADQFSSSVTSLVLISPAGLVSNVPFTAQLVRAPFLGDVIMSMIGSKELANSQRKDFIQDKALCKRSLLSAKIMKERVEWQCKNTPGYLKAVLSSLRHANLSTGRELFQRVGTHQRQGLLIWGAKDTTAPVEDADKVAKLLPNLNFHKIQNAAHASLMEQPHEVLQLLVKHLKSAAVEK